MEPGDDGVENGKPSILLSLLCVCLQRTPIEGGWRGTKGVGGEGETPTRGREGVGGTVTEKYEGWARATKGEARKLGRRNEPSRGGRKRAESEGRGRGEREELGGQKKDSRILEAKSRVVGWSNNRAALNTVIPAIPGLNEGRGRRRK